jgi:hypothetical protein
MYALCVTVTVSSAGGDLQDASLKAPRGGAARRPILRVIYICVWLGGPPVGGPFSGRGLIALKRVVG